MDESSEPLAAPCENPVPAASTAPAAPRPWSRWSQAGFVVAGVLAPLNCFLTAASDGIPGNDAWQSGYPDVYTSLLVAWRPSLPFYPLLAYSIVCLMLLTFGWRRFHTKWSVRWGVYSGVLLAFHYWLLVGIHLLGAKPLVSFESVAALLTWGLGSLLAAVVSWAALLAISWLPRKIGTLLMAQIVGVGFLALFVLGLGSIVLGGVHPLELIFAPIAPVWIISLFVGTPWAFLAYSSMAYSVWRRTPQRHWTLSEMLGAFSWVTVYLGAWRISITLMLEEYAKLPTTNPSCYIATAAARGHRRWVGSAPCVASQGQVFAANDQLRWLKLGELVLASTLPAVHQRCRAVYDRWGPAAAQCLTNPWVADAAYLSLKPFEWGVRLLLGIFLPQSSGWIRRLYKSPALPPV